MLCFSQEVAESGPLLATIAVDQNVVGLQPPPPPSKILEIQTGDPVSQAVVDNIIGKNPTKKEPVSQISLDYLTDQVGHLWL